MSEPVSTEAKAAAALEHLQAAALEMIAASRAVLDVAEDLVKDPAVLLAALKVVAPSDPTAATADGPAPAPRVQHIRVS